MHNDLQGLADITSQPSEYLTIDEAFSPLLHRLGEAIRRRAINPDEPVAPPSEMLLKWSQVPPELVLESVSDLNHLIKVADVKEGSSQNCSQMPTQTANMIHSTAKNERKKVSARKSQTALRH